MFNRMKRWSVGRRKMNKSFNPAASQSVRTLQNSIITASSFSSRRKERKHREAFLKGGVVSRPNQGVIKKKTSVRDVRSGWDFSSISLRSEERVDVASDLVLEAYMFLNEEQGINVPETLVRAAVRSFVLEVEKNYPNSNFHNFAHAIDVAQLMFYLVNRYFSNRVRKSELFYLVIVALCHDLGHIGVTTPTLRKLKIIGEEETLEDFHIEKTLKLMYDSGLSLMSERMLKSEYKAELEEYARFLIDATDIGKCKTYLEKAKKVRIKKKSNLPLEYLAVLMKVSDLANVTRGFDDSRAWGERLKIEMKAEKLFNESYDIPEDLTVAEKLEVVQHEVFVLQKQIKGNEFELHQGLSSNTLNFVSFAVKPIFPILPEIDEVFAADYERRVRENERCWRLML